MAKRRAVRRQRKEKTTILLVTNGRVTEREYLMWVASANNSDPAKKLSVKVQTLDGEPEWILKKLMADANDTTSYEEIWIVVDSDGKDRRKFVKKCLRASTKDQQIRAIVSDPCFEIWLLAHYKTVGNATTQQQAQDQYAKAHGGRAGDKRLPRDFPFDSWRQASQRCTLSSATVPQLDTEYPPCPGTMMPILMKRLFG